MCGITGYLKRKEKQETDNENTENNLGTVFDHIYSSLVRLQNRGYDSSGICTITEQNNLKISKFASTENVMALDLLKHVKANHAKDLIGIGHTRWATHGQKTRENSHPHCDMNKRVSLVHNGIIVNHNQIREKLINVGYVFESQTDTECISQLIGFYLDTGSSFDNALNKCLSELNGTWAIACLYSETPNTIYISCSGMSLLFNMSSDHIHVASQPNVFKSACYKVSDVKTICAYALELTESGSQCREITKGIVDVTKAFEKVESTYDKETLDLKSYPHFTLKEIYEQPSKILSALENRLEAFESTIQCSGLKAFSEHFKKIEHILIIGCGSSFFSGKLASMYFRQISNVSTVQCIDAAEFTKTMIPKNVPTQSIACICISQSGETRDVTLVLKILKKRKILSIGVVNVENTKIAIETDCGMYLNAGKENAVASTKSFTSQMTVLMCMSIWLGSIKQSKVNMIKYIKSLKSLSNDVLVCLTNVHEQCKSIASEIANEKNMFILGKGLAEPIALEGALKIKEISYIHAEGYPGGSLKHGSYALIESGFVCILIVLDDEHKEYMLSTIAELHARNARCICITNVANDINTEKIWRLIHVPKSVGLPSLLALIPLQLLAYELGVQRKCSIDFCRNLAKTVTVD